MKKLWEKYSSAILDALARAFRTMAQTAGGFIGAAAFLSDVNWKAVLSASALAGIVSILMSIDRIAAPVAVSTDSLPPG